MIETKAEIFLRVKLLQGWTGGRGARSAAGRALAAGLLPVGWRIETGEEGRPSATGPAGQVGRDVSIAHSGRWIVAAAVSGGKVGIDIEVPRRGRRTQEIADVYFTSAERRVVATIGESALLAFWTIREAVAKAAGGGLATALALDDPAVVAALGGSAIIRAAGMQWAVAQKSLASVQLAVAWSASDGLGRAAEPAVTSALDEAIASIQSAT